MKNQIFTAANNFLVEVPAETYEHLLAHPEVSDEMLRVAIKRLVPPSTQTVSHVDLFDKYGNWGRSGLVKVDRVNSFAFRKGRIAPSAVVIHEGTPASYMSLVTKPNEAEEGYTLITAFCSDGVGAKPEPITPMVDPRTKKGQRLRQEFLEFWSRHALATGTSPIEGKVFESTWEEILTKYGDVYHQE